MIGILTFYWADDYGAMLQTYALKRYIEKSGKQAEIIPYAPLKLPGRYYFLPIGAVREKNYIRYYFNRWLFRRNLSTGIAFYKRRRNMRKFRQTYLTKEFPIRCAEKLSLQKYSCVFVGSDQVWNPDITIGLDDAYLGKIRDKGGCRLAAYGASFGGARLSEENCGELVEAVKENFAEISLRERRAADYMSELLHRDVANVLDPTLLLDREEWEQIERAPEKKDYIFFYHTEQNEQMTDYLNELSKVFDKEVIQVSMPISPKHKPGISLDVSGGPMEFLGYIQNAYCVVTNSFHGTVFSILMEKQFLVFAHPRKNERIASLLKKLNLESRMVYEGQKVGAEEMERKIDWQKAKECLKQERAVSAAFINENIESP